MVATMRPIKRVPTGSIAFKLGGQAEVALVESALDHANQHFNGAEFNSALSFAVSYLASLIVIYECHVTGIANEFDFELLVDELREAVKLGHATPQRKLS